METDCTVHRRSNIIARERRLLKSCGHDRLKVCACMWRRTPASLANAVDSNGCVRVHPWPESTTQHGDQVHALKSSNLPASTCI